MLHRGVADGWVRIDDHSRRLPQPALHAFRDARRRIFPITRDTLTSVPAGSRNFLIADYCCVHFPSLFSFSSESSTQTAIDKSLASN